MSTLGRTFSISLEIVEGTDRAIFQAAPKTAGDLAHTLRAFADAIDSEPFRQGQTKPAELIERTLKAKGRKR